MMSMWWSVWRGPPHSWSLASEQGRSRLLERAGWVNSWSDSCQWYEAFVCLKDGLVISAIPVIAMRRLSAFFVLCFALCLVVACSTSSEQESADSDDSLEATAKQAEPLEASDEQGSEAVKAEEQPGMAPMWSEEGLESQDRMEDLREVRDGAPGTTPWSSENIEVPEGLGDADADGAVAPGALLVELLSAMGVGAGLGTEVWEQTIRVLQQDGDEAVGVLMQWGFKDDSMAGSDIRAHMRRGDSGWYIERLEQRFHCARGVSDGLCL